MSDCCSTARETEKPSKTNVCPVNGQTYMQVSIRTMLHHISSPWEWAEKEQGYYFCNDPNCDVVYFGEDDSVIEKTQIRTVVGIKEDKPDALTCYCFGVSNLEAQRHPDIRHFIVNKTQAGVCSCETSNPSGRCCLKDLPVSAKTSY